MKRKIWKITFRPQIWDDLIKLASPVPSVSRRLIICASTIPIWSFKFLNRLLKSHLIGVSLQAWWHQDIVPGNKYWFSHIHLHKRNLIIDRYWFHTLQVAKIHSLFFFWSISPPETETLSRFVSRSWYKPRNDLDLLESFHKAVLCWRSGRIPSKQMNGTVLVCFTFVAKEKAVFVQNSSYVMFSFHNSYPCHSLLCVKTMQWYGVSIPYCIKCRIANEIFNSPNLVPSILANKIDKFMVYVLHTWIKSLVMNLWLNPAFHYNLVYISK